MADPTQYPAASALLFVLLSLWPVARIFRRNGQTPALALLLLPSIALPFSGFILCGAAFLLKRKTATQ